MKEFLKDVVGVVEASSYETSCLWKRNQEGREYSWVQGLGGRGAVVGFLYERPVCISLFINIINGHQILFLDPTSALVDWDMIEKWLEENLPKSAFREGTDYVNKVNAQNFYNVFPRA